MIGIENRTTMQLHVCSLSKLDTVASAIRPNRVVSLVRLDPMVATPDGIAPEHHLRLSFHDITTPQAGMVPPTEKHVIELLAFARDWDRRAPMLIHCFAGISRSTAAAFIVACALQPATEEERIADALRAASSSATPNARLVAIADSALGRYGRMVAAVRRIGRGADAFEGQPFSLALDGF
jgi:predicted protein tyrosine phosphatase